MSSLLELTDIQKAVNYNGSTTGPNITTDPILTNFDGDGEYAWFLIQIPRVINRAGSAVTAESAFSNASWSGVVTVTQDGITTPNSMPVSGFTSSSSMFP